MKKYFTILVVLYPKIGKIESKYGAKCENLLSVFTIASNPGHLAPFSQKKGAECTIPAIDIFPTKTDFASKYLFKIAKGTKDLSSISSQKST